MSPILQNIVNGIEQHVPQQYFQDYQKVVLAGQKAISDPQSHANMQLVSNPASRQDPVNTIATGVTGLMMMLYMQSNKQIPIPVLVMASITIMCSVMDFAERGLNIKITPEIISETTQQLNRNLFAKMGISPQMLADAIHSGAQEIQAKQPKKGMLARVQQQGGA